MKKAPHKQIDEITRLQCDSARSMFRIYTLTSNDVNNLSADVRRYINQFYRTDTSVACNITESDYVSVTVTDKTVKEYTDLVMKKTALSKKLMGRAVMKGTGYKFGSFHNYICAYSFFRNVARSLRSAGRWQNAR